MSFTVLSQTSSTENVQATISDALHRAQSFAQSGRVVRRALLDRADLVRSVGPWIVLDSGTVVFDAIDAGHGLGYNAGPMFGVAQYAGAWSGDWQDENVMAVRESLNQFLVRKFDVEFAYKDVETPRELVRTYISANGLDQFEETAAKLESAIRTAFADAAGRMLGDCAERWLSGLRVVGGQFQMDVGDRQAEVLARLARDGVLAEAGKNHELCFVVPLSTKPTDLQVLVERIVAASNDRVSPPATIELRDVRRHYQFHAMLLREKLLGANGQASHRTSAIEFLRGMLPQELRGIGQLLLITGKNWGKFRDPVDALQKAVYEPVRQTSSKTFDGLFKDPFGFGLIVEVDHEIVGLAAAGPLGIFPGERGTIDDPQRVDRHTLYPLDLTVVSSFRGTLGSYLKSAMVLLGTVDGHHAFHGRNRDRMAAAMWAINMSLGSYQIRHLKDDYPDTLPYRDCIYYRCPLQWPKHVDLDELGERQIASMVNA